MSFTAILHTTAGAVLEAAFLLGGVPARASGRDKRCAQLRKAEAQLDRAVRNHGRHSPQAKNRRRDLDRVGAQCNRGGKV